MKPVYVNDAKSPQSSTCKEPILAGILKEHATPNSMFFMLLETPPKAPNEGIHVKDSKAQNDPQPYLLNPN